MDSGGGREMSRRELLNMVAPARGILSPAMVVLDRERCSACALCARDCPTGAISASGEGAISLMFHSGLCDECGACVETCPEKCLRVEQAGDQSDTAALLFQDEFAHCEVCGGIIGSRAMIQRVRSKLQGNDPALAAKIQLCPSCKGKKK